MLENMYHNLTLNELIQAVLVLMKYDNVIPVLESEVNI